MIRLFDSLRQIYRNEGAEILIREICKHAFLRCASYISPDSTEIKIDDRISATFSTKPLPPLNFRHDIHAEKPVIRSLLNDIQSTDTFFDVGANVGAFSAFVGQSIGQDGCVIAFDPNPSALPFLYNNLQHNCGESLIFAIGLGDKYGFGRMTPYFSTNASVEGSSGVNIHITTIDTLIDEENIPQPDVLKIDVEGAEETVLRGATAALSNTEVVYVEVHPTDERDAEDNAEVIKGQLQRHFDVVDTIRAPDKEIHVRGRVNERIP